MTIKINEKKMIPKFSIGVMVKLGFDL